MFKKFFTWIKSFDVKSWTVNAIRNTRNLFGNISLGVIGACTIGGVLAFFGVPTNISVGIGKLLVKICVNGLVIGSVLGTILGREV